MKKRFIAKRRLKKGVIKFLVILIVIILSFIITFKFLYNKINININEEKYLNYLVKDSLGTYSLDDLTNLSSLDFLLKYSFGIDNVDTKLADKEITKPIEVEIPLNEDPIVYIYNSHQTEAYNSPFLENFNINNTVLMASYILREYLADLNINSIVEENNIVDVLNANGWKYNSSYKASRILMEDAYKNNKQLNYFIDLHRDAGSYEGTTIEIEGKKYAKVLFVIGKENPDYEKNLAMAENLDKKIKDFNPKLSRGIILKEGKGVNGKYNQDFHPNTILIEIGGQYNNIEEVNNTLKIVSKVLFLYIEENSNDKEKN